MILELVKANENVPEISGDINQMNVQGLRTLFENYIFYDLGRTGPKIVISFMRLQKLVTDDNQIRLLY